MAVQPRISAATTQRRIRSTVRLQQDERDALERLARHLKWSRSYIVRVAIRHLSRTVVLGQGVYMTLEGWPNP
jgi:predicted transcriptional regulator